MFVLPLTQMKFLREREEEERERRGISCYAVLYMPSKYRHVLFLSWHMLAFSQKKWKDVDS